jgi:hypothetical protein
MPELTYDQAVLLRRIADGEPVTVVEADARGLIADGLLRALTPQDVADIRQYRETVLETDHLDKELHCTLHPTGLEHVRFDVLPGVHRTHEQHADELRDRIDRCKSATSAAWLSLSERDLMHVDPDSCALTADGGALDITDPGKDAARAFVWSEAFETRYIHQDALDARAARYIDLRQALLDTGFAGDPRLDLAAAILSRHETSIDRYCEYNRLAVHEHWLTYDRLPLLAALCRLEGSPDDIWPRFLAGYERVLATDLGVGVEGRLVTLSLMDQRGKSTLCDVTDEALARVLHIRKQLCLVGWPNEQCSNPIAATLTHSRLPTGAVAARQYQLSAALDRGGTTIGGYASLAANIAITWNLFQSVSTAADAKVMEDNTVFDDFIERYDMLLKHFEGDDSRRAVPPYPSRAVARHTGEQLGEVQCLVNHGGRAHLRGRYPAHRPDAGGLGLCGLVRLLGVPVGVRLHVAHGEGIVGVRRTAENGHGAHGIWHGRSGSIRIQDRLYLSRYDGVREELPEVPPLVHTA